MTLLRPTVKFRRLPHGDGLPLPAYQSEGAAGIDLHAAETMTILQRKPYRVPTGFCVDIPEGYEGQIRPRSSLAARQIMVTNSPGTIDSDYRGEIMILMHTINLGAQIKRGDRIAQLVIAPVARAEIVEVEELDDTERGDGGFGHTGLR